MTPQILYNRRWSRNNPTTSSKGKEHYKTILDRRLSGTIYQSNPLDDPKGNRVVLSSFRRGKIRLTSLGTILQSKGLHKVSPFLFFFFYPSPLLREGRKIGDGSEEEGRLDNSPMAIPCINIVRWISTGEAFVSRNRSRGEMIQNRETSNPLRGVAYRFEKREIARVWIPWEFALQYVSPFFFF